MTSHLVIAMTAAITVGTLLGQVATVLWGDVAGAMIGGIVAALAWSYLYEAVVTWYDRNKRKET